MLTGSSRPSPTVPVITVRALQVTADIPIVACVLIIDSNDKPAYAINATPTLEPTSF
jgi:hypothetical protein